MEPMPYTREDFSTSPLLVFYEITRACNLKCEHCRAQAQVRPHPQELTHQQSIELMNNLATFPKKPLLVLTGGDPMKRSDIYEVIRHGVSLGLRVAVTPATTRLVDSEAVAKLKEAGVSRLAISLDAADAELHDKIRGVPGSFSRSMKILAAARDQGLGVQINTTVSRVNVDHLDRMAEMLAREGIVLWSVFFLVPVGRATADQRLSGTQCEEVFEKLWKHTLRQPYAIKTTEAPHYRRYVMQNRQVEDTADGFNLSMGRRLPVMGTNDGKGVIFVSHIGEIYPSGFLPMEVGRFPKDSVVDVYQNSPMLKSLREPDQLQGKCGRCGYRSLCGGSRARAFGVTGNPLAAEPDCIYQPAGEEAMVSCSL